ncbi:MAG: hypothetical protein AAGH79_01935 [Bacteroidota bacterium]
MEKEKDRIIKELEGLNSSLAKWKQSGKEEGFQVPGGYFAQLQKDLKAKLEEPAPAEKPRTKLIPLRSRRLLSVAASVLVLLVAGTFWWQMSSPSAMADPSNIELADYVQANLDDFELELLTKYVVADEETNLDFLPVEDPLEKEEMDQLIDDLMEEMDWSELEELL